VPEAGSYQIPSEGLKAETSRNVDLGARYQNEVFFVEGFRFWNKIFNGIRARPVLDQAGDTVQTNGLATYQNVNVGRINLSGEELNVDVRLPNGITFGSSYSRLRAEDALDPENPIGESYARKVTERAGYRDPEGRFWAEWETRFSGEQKGAALGTDNPLGLVVPSFRVHGIRAGTRLVASDGFTYRLTVSLNNLTNELYAETANASFFRPEPGRNITVSMDVSF
jgi:outer membrane receptor protein involved in Fe transport